MGDFITVKKEHDCQEQPIDTEVAPPSHAVLDLSIPSNIRLEIFVQSINRFAKST